MIEMSTHHEVNIVLTQVRDEISAITVSVATKY